MGEKESKEESGREDGAESPDLRDPKIADRIRSPHYEEIYCNRAEITITKLEVRIKFSQVFGKDEPGHKGKFLVEERGGVTMALPQAVSVSNALVEGIANHLKKIGWTETDLVESHLLSGDQAEKSPQEP